MPGPEQRRLMLVRTAGLGVLAAWLALRWRRPGLVAAPCENDEAFRAFDFWLGDWVVHGPAGNVAGHNRIERSQRGCVLVENWTSATGGTGTSGSSSPSRYAFS